jgi:protein-histidine pros-kinase
MGPSSSHLQPADTGGEFEFLAATVHELRTPLNSILGFTGTLLLRLPGPLNAEQKHQLECVERAGRYLLTLVDDLLHFAREARSLVHPARRSFVVQDLVREVLELLRPLADARNLKLVADLPAQQLRVRSDRRAWMQILLNLASNGIKFTDHGEVRVELERVQAAAHPELRLRVVDTGHGIAHEQQGRLFRPYERLEPAKSGGSGLGLYLSQRLAQKLGGRIRCRSRVGSGSTFEFRLRLE